MASTSTLSPPLASTSTSTSNPTPTPTPTQTQTQTQALKPPLSTPARPDPVQEYATFLHPNFDPNQFAHSIVNDQPYVPPPLDGASEADTLEDGAHAASSLFMKALERDGSALKRAGAVAGGGVGGALAHLSFGVEELNRQLKAEITKHHSSLLLQAASLGGLEGDLNEVRHGLKEVEAGVTRLRRKIATPHSSLSASLQLLTRLRRTSSLARRSHRFIVLAKRLEAQMNEIDGVVVEDADKVLSKSSTNGGTNSGTGGERTERVMAEAALTLAEIELLLNEGSENDSELISIRSVPLIAAQVPAVSSSRERVVLSMESTVQRGLSTLDHPLLASSLQTAHNLSVLPQLVDALLASLNDVVSREVRRAFDMASLAKEVNAKGFKPGMSPDPSQSSGPTSFVYKSRARTEPTSVTLPLWQSTLWARMETLVSEMGAICIKVYTLEKVLKLKRDQMTQTSFLDEAMTALDERPSAMFWTTFASTLEQHTKETARSSAFVQTTVASSYPRLLRLLHEFFTKIAVHTDTVYSSTQQSSEAVQTLRAIQPFETLYLTRSSNRLLESVGSAFSLSSASSNASRTIPTANEGLGTARAIVNELDAARFDPLLVKNIAKGAARAVDTFVGTAESLIARDHSSTSLLGPLATPSQHSNAELASSLYHLWSPLHRALLGEQYGIEPVQVALRPSIDRIRHVYLNISKPLIMAIRREFSTILARMHRTDYSKSNEEGTAPNSQSAYMTDLTDKLSLVRDEILGTYRVGDLAKEWALDLSRFIVQTFLLHASLITPLGESGKLKLVADTASLEFSVSAYLSSHALALAAMGDQFKALRAWRPLLFLPDKDLVARATTGDVPTLILLHHALGRAASACREGRIQVKLPHQVQGWTEGDYVRWLNEHGETDRLAMVSMSVDAWNKEKEVLARDEEDETIGQEGQAVIAIVSEILARTGSTA
ncbi:BZ3500_MvSof-1268-A1-R1_Chr10-2g02931 [Microbotryum saponariae]|uniref:Conserved oligomeric Golgi complex subunit 5 n=1 Tax=Microbotryum saponariae TaxID=289078 RepID=A0A2X0K771_9BASI|nr:BZ3501_MvSof-1269-A2-R1_Chr10-2g02517 [Microbotryum saponariae]SDA01767.1 BZ3500_MvSof-1268-A1-R1_Chr10-2g02931 [Microbotryum saponariae]